MSRSNDGPWSVCKRTTRQGVVCSRSIVRFLVWIACWCAASRVTGDLITQEGPRNTERQNRLSELVARELPEEDIAKLGTSLRSLEIGDIQNFRKGYDELAATSSSLPAVEVFLGKLLITNNQIADATQMLEEYVLKNQEDAEAHVALGIIAMKTGRFSDAWLQSLYAQRLVDRGKLPEARTKFALPSLTELRAEVAERRQQWSESEQLFLKLYELLPGQGYAMLRAGRTKVLAGDLKGSYELLKQARQNHPNLPLPELTIAQVLEANTDWVRDREHVVRIDSWMELALKEHPDELSAGSSYMHWLLLSDRPQEAIALYQTLSEPHKLDRNVTLLRCLAARYLQDYSTAEQLLTEAMAVHPDDLDFSDQLAQVLVESGDADKLKRAAELAESNSKRSPASEATIATLAWVKTHSGELGPAATLLQPLASRGQMSAQTAYYLARLLAKQGKFDDSHRLLAAAANTRGLFPQRAQVNRELTGK
ncbi:MAG: tetratricopeptide repeat protein [Pirellulaceae bacterium]|nr:tetratricopeptide repeat protein [Pirellulaceae bacterium]